MAFPGEDFLKNLNPRIKEAFLTTAGFPQTNVALSYESMPILHLSTDGNLGMAKTKGQPLQKGHNANYAYSLTPKLKTLAAGNKEWFNLIKLAQKPCQLFAADENGQFLNLTLMSNDDPFGSPDGSTWGVTLNGTKRTITKDSRFIEINGQAQASQAMLAYMYNSARLAAYVTGQTGGVTCDLVDISAEPIPFADAFKIEIGTGSIGNMFDFTLTEEIMGKELLRGQYTTRILKQTLSFKASQTDGPMILAGNEAFFTDNVVKLYTLNGETFQWDAKTFNGDFTVDTFGYDYPMWEGELTVELPFNIDNATPNHIDYSDDMNPVFTLTN